MHAFALLCYVRVWLWHLTPAAQLLPGSTGFGWFFRYLTFYSYSWQMLQLFIACLADISKVANRCNPSHTPNCISCGMPSTFSVSLLLQDPVQSKKLNIWADDLSCALFGMANSVTAMYYLIDATTGSAALVEGGEISRPPWLGFSVHVFNTITAWADICCAHPRSFSKRSSRLSVGIVAFYTVWILICSHFNGAFPYPILNELPWPAVSMIIPPHSFVVHLGSYCMSMTAGVSRAGVHWNGICKYHCVLSHVPCWTTALHKTVVETC